MTNEEIESVVTKGINERIAKKYFVSSTEYTAAMNLAYERAKRSETPLQFSADAVKAALLTDSQIDYLAKRNTTIVLKGKNADRSTVDKYYKIFKKAKTSERKKSLDYCFLKCMSTVSAAFHNKNEASRAYNNTTRTYGDSHNDSYEAYISEAYMKFLFMMQDGSYLKSGYKGTFSAKKFADFADDKLKSGKMKKSEYQNFLKDLKDGKSIIYDGVEHKPEEFYTIRQASFNFDAITKAIDANKNKGSSKIPNYDYFNAIQGRFYAELLNTNRDLLADETQEGISGLGTQKSVTFKGADGKDITRNVINTVDSTSFQTEKNGKDEEMSAEDSMEYKYMKSNGLLTNDIEADAATNAFMEKWEECCKDVHYTSQGKPNRWAYVKKTADGKEKPNRKAKILKYIIINALSGLGSSSSKDLYEDFYNDIPNPKQKWDGEVAGTLTNGNKELSIKYILEEYNIQVPEIINACNVLGADVVLGKLKGMGSQLPDSETKRKGTAAGKQITGKVQNYTDENGKLQAKVIDGNRDLLNEMSLTKDGNKLFQSFNTAISKLKESNDWSESNVEKVLNENLKGGINTHKRTWKTFSVLFDLGLDNNQRDLVYNAITK